MAPRLDGSQAKRNRAQTHLNAVEKLIGDFLGSNPYPISIEAYPEQGRYLIRLQDRRPLPATELALVIGDCVHNMRSALDYIAWELAGARLDDRRTMFPICDTETSFKKLAWRIEAVPDRPRAVIQELQPYRTPHPKLAALWAIEHFDVADKHKLLTIAVPVTDSFFCTYPLAEHVEGDFTLGLFYPKPTASLDSLEEDAIIAEVSISPPVPDMEVDPKFTPQIAFGESIALGPSMFVVSNLKGMLAEVDSVIARFTPFFGAAHRSEL